MSLSSLSPRPADSSTDRSRHLPADLRQAVAEAAAAVDAGEATLVPHLQALGRAGLLDLGIDDLVAGSSRARDVRGTAYVIADLARECVSTAFCLFAHHMVLDYLARGVRSAATEEVFARLRVGDLLGSSAMVAGRRGPDGAQELVVRGRVEGGEVVLDGVIPWASNVVPDAVIVLSAQLDDGRRVALWTQAGVPGLQVHPVRGLLALNATASASLRLEGVRVGLDQVVTDDLGALIRSFRPTFLTVQSSFCVGLADRALEEAAARLDSPGVHGLRERHVAALAAYDELASRWDRLARDVEAADVPEFLRLRLDASLVAAEATRVESALAGGRGYLVRTDTSRRFREAAFLPVQTPSEDQLRAELQALSA